MFQNERSVGVVARLRQRNRGDQTQRIGAVGVEGRRAAIGPELQVVERAGIVEARRALHLEGDAAAHAAHDPNQALRPVVDRHQIDGLGQPFGGEEPGHEDVGVRQVDLLVAHVVAEARRDPELAALLGVEQRREHRGGIEARPAQEVDGAAEIDEAHGVHVADDAVMFDPGIVAPGLAALRRLGRLLPSREAAVVHVIPSCPHRHAARQIVPQAAMARPARPPLRDAEGRAWRPRRATFVRHRLSQRLARVGM